MSRLFGQITPSLPARFRIASGSSRNRAAGTRIAPSLGSSAPSGTWTNRSAAIFPSLTSGIDPLPEWFDAEPLHRIDEQFVRARAQGEIGFNDVLDHVCNIDVRHRRADQGAHLGAL